MKRVLVTGADGFIGSHLAEALAQAGYEVRAFVYYNSLGSWGWLESVPESVRNCLEVVSGDIRDFDCVREAATECDAICHLAALIAIPYSYRAARSFIDTNVTGTLNVMQAGREAGATRIIQTSTSEVYGTAQFVPISEEHPLNAQSPYAASKIGSDQVALSFVHSFGLPVTVLRPFNTYGPRQSARAVIPTIITQLLADQNEIKLGSLFPTRDFNFIADTVSAFVAALEAEEASVVGEVINIGSGFEISIEQTAELIADVLGREFTFSQEAQRIRPEASEVDRLLCSNLKAKSALEWTPYYAGLDGFRRGLEETIEWFSVPENHAFYKSDIYNV